MAVFEYRGLTVASGKNVRGVKDADNMKMLRAVLKREGVMLTEAHEDTTHKVGGTKKTFDFKQFFERVTTSDVAMMTRQLSTLIGAGIPLVEAVTALQEQVDKEGLRRALANVRDRLNEGSDLAKALEQHPKLFPPLYVNMVAAGEASGTLEAVFDRLSDFMENSAKLKGKVGAALAYPILMMIMGVVIMTLMMVVVVPKVTSIFATLDRALPWYTELLIFISNTLSSNQFVGCVLTMVTLSFTRLAIAHGRKSVYTYFATGTFAFMGVVAFLVSSLTLYVIGIGVGIVLGLVLARFLAFLATPAGIMWRDTRKLRLPLFGSIFRMLAVARFSRTLSTLLKSGVPLLKALEIVRYVLDNVRLAAVVEEAAVAIREGESIAIPLKRSGEFPSMVTHMIAVGEKSGELEGMLENVARAYDAQVETRLQAMTSLLEPLIIVFMGGGVGFIAFSILMPLIQKNDAF